MANKGQENLIPFTERTEEEQREIARQGGIRSGEVRREKATMKATLEMLLNETNKNGKTYRELATLGLLKGAINGNAQNYRTILKTLGELKQAEESKSQQELSKLDILLEEIKKDANK
ncbi:MAG: hypothetical protein IJ690_01965 [Clostridia bacterium]|nr:hypothetical protein [Clostridia bacterium]MBR1653707.1 hypothetical protein [Clostridia bacterium]